MVLTREQFITLLYAENSKIECVVYNGLDIKAMREVYACLLGEAQILPEGESLRLVSYKDKDWTIELSLGITDGKFDDSENIEIYDNATGLEIDYDKLGFGSFNIEISLADSYAKYLSCADSDWNKNIVLFREDVAYSCYLTMCLAVGNQDYLVGGC